MIHRLSTKKAMNRTTAGRLLQRARRIEHGEQGDAHVGYDRFPHRREAQRAEPEERQLDTQREYDVLRDDAPGPLGPL